MVLILTMECISISSQINVRQKFLLNKIPSQKRTLFAMCGIPGAGKSTFVAEALNRQVFSQDAFILNPDHVMKTLPEYKACLHGNGAEIAFTKWEMPARELAYSMFNAAVAKQLDVIIDMGCVREEDLNNILNCKQHGYYIDMHYIYCPVDVAAKRLGTRVRHTPIDMLQSRQKMLEALLPQYRILSDQFTLYDNSNLKNPFCVITHEDRKAG